MIHAFDNGDLRSISKALNAITASARLDIKWLKARLAGKPIDPSVMRAREAAMLADALNKAVAQSPSNEGLRSVLPELISLERYERQRYHDVGVPFANLMHSDRRSTHHRSREQQGFGAPAQTSSCPYGLSLDASCHAVLLVVNCIAF
jgi:hypothetical protein